ncbi:uncharacterized protein PF11_0207-like [Ipomoea triloba]|uniref:uncharacterized protein PF11_0207-like n=1 Tax=Ipomoea triloba TaxID=35885 RepID=UPI00125DA01F|nr:uncharacterized protein PF11_0207-like [Ipomoea triloba]
MQPRGGYNDQFSNPYGYEDNEDFRAQYQPRSPPPPWARYDDQRMAYDDYYRPKRNQSHYDETQDHYRNQHEGDYEEYISQERYHHAPPQNFYSQNVYPHNSYSEQIHYSQSPRNEKYVPYMRDEHYPSYTQNPQYPPYSQDHQDYPYYSNHYENEEYMMQPYEEEITEDTKNKILAIMEEFKQDMTNMREEWSDSFDPSDDDDENCVDPCENNFFVSLNENDVLESFTFDDESLSNELTNDLHEICGDDDVNIEASLCDLNDIECVTFHDNCLDDALYIHDLIGKDRSEVVKNENVKEEVEEKEEIRNESVREEVEEKVKNDQKEFGEEKKNEKKKKKGKLEDNSILRDMDSCKPLEESMLCIELKEFANARHLRAYLEERVDGAKGLVPVQI